MSDINFISNGTHHTAERWTSRVLQLGVWVSASLMILGLLIATISPSSIVAFNTNPSLGNLMERLFSTTFDPVTLMFVGLVMLKADTDALGDVLTETPAHLHKIVVEPSVTILNVAVTQDAKDNHTADFTVNLKVPLSCKEAPTPGAVLRPAAQRYGAGRNLRHLHQGRSIGLDRRDGADRAQRRICAAGEEDGSHAPSGETSRGAPRGVTAPDNKLLGFERAVRFCGLPFFYANTMPPGCGPRRVQAISLDTKTAMPSRPTARNCSTRRGSRSAESIGFSNAGAASVFQYPSGPVQFMRIGYGEGDSEK